MIRAHLVYKVSYGRVCVDEQHEAAVCAAVQKTIVQDKKEIQSTPTLAMHPAAYRCDCSSGFLCTSNNQAYFETPVWSDRPR